MTQKIVFLKASVTIDDILKELIYTKKINLSYSPDDLNLDEAINLPSKEIMIGDLLKLISNKTGNKLIVKGSQIIIKKDRNVLPQQLVQPVQASIKEIAKDTLVVREINMTPIVPRASLIARGDSFRAKLELVSTISPLTTSLRANEPEKTDFPTQIKEVKKSQATRKLKDKVMFGASAGIGTSFLTNLADTGQNLKTKAALAWNLQTNILFKPGEKWLLETEIGLNHSNYSVTSHFNRLAVSDSLSYDTISSQNINLKINNLEIPVMVNYYFKVKKNNIITGVGGSK
jgi:hypothetical protein